MIIKDYLKRIENTNYDLMWARVWDDTRRGIRWLDDLPSISPGRWAVGYNYIYVMTRVLDAVEPCKVLEMGLGISSTLISCYFRGSSAESHKHTIIEHNKEWIDFYTKKNSLSDCTDIVLTNCEEKVYKKHKYYAYENFKNIIGSEKYEVISIDGPYGSDRYSRRDIVECLPEILDEKFVIIMDDTHRKGEQDTLKEIESVLAQNSIKYIYAWYPGLTGCSLICSEDYSFLKSL